MADIVVLDEDATALSELLEVEHVAVTRVEMAPDAEVLLASPRLAALAMASMPSLRWIQSTWAGIDALAAVPVPPQVVVTGLKGIFGTQMSEYVIAHLLAHTQRVVDRAVVHRWDETPPNLVAGSRVGILGTGSIGSAVAMAIGRLGAEVTGCSRSGRPAPGFDRVHPVAELVRFAAGLHHLVVILPGTADTASLVDSRVLEALADGATLINAGRGVTVDTDAVVDALRSGKLGRATLDVLPNEPVAENDPLWEVSGLVITSHTAAWSRPVDVVGFFVENLGRWRSGEPLHGVIDLVRGY